MHACVAFGHCFCSAKRDEEKEYVEAAMEEEEVEKRMHIELIVAVARKIAFPSVACQTIIKKKCGKAKRMKLREATKRET